MSEPVGIQPLFHEYLRALFVLFKSSFVYETNNRALIQSAGRVAAAANVIRNDVADIASIELGADGAYGNRTLLKLDPATYDQADYLYAITSTVGLAAIEALDDTEAQDWVDLVAAFKQCVGPGGTLADFVATTFPRIRLVPGAVSAATNVLALTNRFRALRAYATTVIAIGELLDAMREGHALRPLRIKRPLQELISVADEAAPLLLALAHAKRHKLRLQHHLTNTAVFVVCATRSLGLPRALRCSLGLTAALHDIGRDDTRELGGIAAERASALTTVRALVGSPYASSQMLERAVVANEVRRWVDATAEPAGDDAYPTQLGAAARVIAVGHAYSRLTTPRAERGSLLPDEALRFIMREAGRRYDAVAVKLFVNTLGIYPVGSTVALSDGRIALVVECNDAHEPVVKIVRTTQGQVIDGELVDLSTIGGAVTIASSVDAESTINAPAFLLG